MIRSAVISVLLAFALISPVGAQAPNPPSGTSQGAIGSVGPPSCYSRPGWSFRDCTKAYGTPGFSPRVSRDGMAQFCCDTAQWERVCQLPGPSPMGYSCSCPNVMALVDFQTCP
jgi:hypothetical protein